jgi:hypothetical protein
MGRALMQLVENHQHATHAALELELCSWQDIADPKLHETINSLAARPSEARLRQRCDTSGGSGITSFTDSHFHPT